MTCAALSGQRGGGRRPAAALPAGHVFTGRRRRPISARAECRRRPGLTEARAAPAGRAI